MSYLLELLGQGLDCEVGDVLDRYYWSPALEGPGALEAQCHREPDRADLRRNLGLAHLRAMDTTKAVEHLSEACKLAADDIAARLALAAACEDRSELDAALEHLKIANRQKPGEVPILFAIGLCLEKLHKPLEAAAYYRDAIIADGRFLPARKRLAAVATLLEELTEAIDQYQALADAEPQATWIRSARAHLLYRAGRFDEAVDEFQTALALEPENWALMDDQVEAMVADGRIREAIDVLHGMIEQQGDFADMYTRLADLYGMVGDDRTAQKYYARALDLQPEYIEATVKLGTHHLVCGRWEEAAEAFHRAGELNDRAMINYIGMGVAQMAKGDPAEAMNSFDLAAAIEPNSTLLLSETARLQLKAALADDFLDAFALGEQLTPADIELDNDDLLHKQLQRHEQQIQDRGDHADVRYRYGVLLRAENRTAEAADQFACAVEINPSYVEAIIKLGICQQELGRIEQAVTTFQKALELKGDYVDLHYRLGLLYTDRRRFEQAVQHLELAAEGAPDNQQIRASLALSLQNMGLMDRAAATWRSLWQIHHATVKQGP